VTAEADAAWPAPRLRRLSSSKTVELLEHSQLGPIYKVHQDEGWYLHQPTRCGKVVSTKRGMRPFRWQSEQYQPSGNAQRATCLSYHPILSFPPRYRGAVYCSAWRPGLSRLRRSSARAISCSFAALYSQRLTGPGLATSNACSTTRSPPTCDAAGSRSV
jgi:hypothetical protein